MCLRRSLVNEAFLLSQASEKLGSRVPKSLFRLFRFPRITQTNLEATLSEGKLVRLNSF